MNVIRTAGIGGLSRESVISQNINVACNDSTGIQEICISFFVPLVSFVSSNPVVGEVNGDFATVGASGPAAPGAWRH